MKKITTLNEDVLIDTLKNAGRPLRLDDILRITRLSRRLKRDVLDVLYDLARNQEVVRLPGGTWAMAANMKVRRGRLALQRSGAAFVTPEGESQRSGKDVYIAPEYIGDAWNGDMVDVMLLPGRHGSDKGPEGRILAVVERGHSEVVARVLHEGPDGAMLCRPSDARLTFDIMADVSALKKRPEEFELLQITMGDKISDQGRRPLWAGRATAALGMENNAAVQERLTKLNNLIPMEFPDNVLEEAREAAARPLITEGLEDLRDAGLVTIDGEDARDFDDAVCVLPEGKHWHLLVAIADVSYYVRPRTALDREARERGNSYYFPTSVEPMLPEALCNGVCSLRPHEDRRCMAVDMELDNEGNMISSRFVNGIMRSHARLTYRQVQDALDNPSGEAAMLLEKNAPGVRGMLQDAAVLARTLIERRHRQGGLDFDIPEAEFVVEDRNGQLQVTGIRNRERLFAHRLIEAFMVRANEAVAEFLSKKQAPFLYRTHPAPGPDKLEDLYRALRFSDADVPLPSASRISQSAWLTDVLDDAAGTDQAFVVNRLVLRSMMQARYSPEEDGHFGLASAKYCHFTSPIRRYADLVNHRALRYVLGLDTGGPIPAGHKLLEVADQCNAHERSATDAEREISRRMGCLLLQNRTGDIFEGVISGVMSFGLFVELDGMPVEGMIRVETLGRDYYVYDEDRQELRGQHTGESFRLGQKVTVKLAGVHIGRLEIDLEYQYNDEGHRPSRKKEDRRRPSERRAFAGRHNKDHGNADFRSRQRRYATEAWGEEEESRSPRQSFGHDAHRKERRENDRTERPFRSLQKDRDEHQDHGFHPRRPSFHEEEDPGCGNRSFSGKRRSFRSRSRREDAWSPEEEGGFRRPKRNREESNSRHHVFENRNEEYEDRPSRHPFRRDKRYEKHGERPFRSHASPYGQDSREQHEERRNRHFPPKRSSFHEGYEEEQSSSFHSKNKERHSPRERRLTSPAPEERGQFHDSFSERRKKDRFSDRHHDSRKGKRDGFHGAPDDFFSIDIEESRPVHRFGKRRA